MPEPVKARFRSGTLLLSLLLWLALIGGFFAVVNRGHGSTNGPPGGGVGTHGAFSHVYPADPIPFERPPVGTSSPYVPSKYRLHTNASATNISALATLAPYQILLKVAPGVWRLSKPMELGVGSIISLTGPLRIELAPGAFILAQHNSTLSLTDVTVVSVDGAGHLQTKPVSGRGYIDARSGALLQLSHDTFIDLGYLSDQTYGVTIDGGSNLSFMRHCTVTGNYFGVYIGRVSGVVIANNRFINSVIYGIDPHTYDSHLFILDNTVIGSGVHGIVVADHVTDSVISGNQVLNSKDHGIVLYQFADHNTISGNFISGTFDGLVVTDSSSNHFVANTVSSATRFGVRLSGISTGNVMERNVISHTLLAVYVYQGATNNQIINNSFSANYENVRVRSDAPTNTVAPDPGRSEL